MGKTVFKLTDEKKEQLISLYEQGLTDSQIATIIGNITDGTVFYWRKKLNLKSKFDYSKVSKIDKKEFEELFEKKYTDREIAEKLNVTADGVYSFRMRNSYVRENYNVNKPIELSELQKEVLVGTLLGDSSLILTEKSKGAHLVCTHSAMQKEYCEYKTEIFSSIGAHCRHDIRKTVDKRTGKFYESYTLLTPNNPALNEWYRIFYPNKTKVIPKQLFSYFTNISLAFLFMDDGAKCNKHGYTIATNCFTIDDINEFREMLKDKFNIETSLQKTHALYIKANSQKIFENLISPYICDCMKYKLQNSVS